MLTSAEAIDAANRSIFQGIGAAMEKIQSFEQTTGRFTRRSCRHRNSWRTRAGEVEVRKSARYNPCHGSWTVFAVLYDSG
jgi:hypothetical protein